MRLSELTIGQRTVVQIIWGERKIEFFADVLETSEKSVYVTPYMHQGNPLDLSIDANSKITCSLFADSPKNNQRISWRNIELATVDRNGAKVYLLTTSGYNNMSKHDDRRQHERLIVHRDGYVYDPVAKQQVSIMVHDVSDIGISFYVAPSFKTSARQISVLFEDKVKDNIFSMKIDCVPVRVQNNSGMSFWGCRIVGENKDFLLYSFLLRLMNKNANREARYEVKEETNETGETSETGD